MSGIKIFECALCKNEVARGLKNSRRFYGTRKEVREHLRKEHHINRQAGTPQHKGNRLKHNRDITGKISVQDERSIVTQNCILYKEY